MMSILFVCSLLLVLPGCKGAGSGRGHGEDIDPEGVFNDPLYERFEDGIRITDVQFSSVLFSYDSFTVANSETVKIERVAHYMRANPNVRLIVEGHCDERGSREYNMSLGEHRALAVRAYLISHGINAQRIQTRSYGEERPVSHGHSESSWRLNRRGEFALYR